MEMLYLKKAEVVDKIAEIIKQTQGGAPLGKRIAIVTRDHNHANYLRRELSRKLPVLTGVNIGPVNDMIDTMLPFEPLASNLSRKIAMMDALKSLASTKRLDKALLINATAHPITTADSMLRLLDSIREMEKDPYAVFPLSRDIVDEYRLKLSGMGLKDRADIVSKFQVKGFDLLIIDRKGHLEQLENRILNEMETNSGRVMKIELEFDSVTYAALLEGTMPEAPIPLKGVHFGEFPKRRDEISQAVRLSKDLLRNGTDPKDIGVCGPDEYLEFLAEEMKRAGVPVTYTFNLPLTGTPVNDALEAIFELSREPQNPKAILQLVKSDLILLKIPGKGELTPSLGPDILEEIILRWGISQPKDWTWALGKEVDFAKMKPFSTTDYQDRVEKFRDYLKSIGNSIKEMQALATLSGHALQLHANVKNSQILKNLGSEKAIKEDPSAVSDGARVYFNVEKVLLEMERSATMIQITKDEFFEILDQELSKKMRSASTRVEGGVSIVTYDEAEMVPFEKCIIIGAGQAVLPSPMIPPPLIDNLTFKDLKPDEHINTDRMAKITLLSMVNGCAESYLSHNIEDKDTWSPVVRQFKEIIGPGNPWTASEKISTRRDALKLLNPFGPSLGLTGCGDIIIAGKALIERESGSEAYNGKLDETAIKTIRDRMGSNEPWSVSRFENYMECPFNYLCKEIYKIDEPDIAEPQIDPRIRGSIVHDVLQEYAQGIIDKKFDPIKDGKAKICEITRTHIMKSLLHPIFKERLEYYLIGSGSSGEGLLLNFVDNDNKEGTSPMLAEASFSIKQHMNSIVNESEPIEIGYPDGFKNDIPDFTVPKMRFRGKIDRIESLHGYWHVVDYKTKNKTEFTIGKDKLPAIQLPVYHEAVSRIFSSKYLTGLKPGGVYQYLLDPSALGYGGPGNELFLITDAGKEEQIPKTLCAEIKNNGKLKGGKSTIKDFADKFREKDPLEAACLQTDPKDLSKAKDAVEKKMKSYGFDDIVGFAMHKYKQKAFLGMYDKYKDMLNGVFKPEPSGCDYCHLKFLCKVDASGGEE